MSYELSDAQFEARAVEDTWVNTLLTLLAMYLHWLQPLLTKSNFEHVVGLLLEKVSRSVSPFKRRLESLQCPCIWPRAQ